MCNLTQTASLSVPPSFCADTGSTHTLLRKSDAPYIALGEPTLNVLLPNGHTITSVGTCLLYMPNLPRALLAHVFLDHALNTSLLSIAQLCGMGCVATFNHTTVHVTNNNLTVLCSIKVPASNLWTIPLPKHTNQPFAAATHALSADAEFVRFTHAALGSPSLSTLAKAVRRGYFHLYPRLTSTILSAYPPHSIATAQGHLDQHRKGQHSTKTPIIIFDSDSDSDIEPLSDDTSDTCNSQTNLAYTKIVIISDTLHSDLTGRFPVTSTTGAQYIFVSVLDGYIHVETMKTRHHTDYVAAYKKTLNFFARLGRRPSFQRLDNETSGQLEAFAISSDITVQYCPPHTHRSLKAERAIRTFKNHFIATLCTVAPEFPLTLWDELLPQVEICLNHLLPYSPNQSVSAYAGLHGGAFDFARHPIAPAGTRIVIHDKPAVRSSWAPHGVSGYYLGPAIQHYRSYRVWSSTTKAIRITDTVAWFPHSLTVPRYSAHDTLLIAVDALMSTLTDFSRLPSSLRYDPQPAHPLIHSVINSLTTLCGLL